MCYRGIFKQTALARNLFLSFLDSPGWIMCFLHVCLCIFIRALSNRKLTMQYRFGAIRPHISPTVAKQSCKNIDGQLWLCQHKRYDLVKMLGLMNVSQRRDYFMIMLMFKSIHGLVPNYLCDEITMQRDIAERTTRSTIDNQTFHWGWLLAFEHCIIISRTQKHTDRQRHKANNPSELPGWYKAIEI